MNNRGGAWDNAKEYIESGALWWQGAQKTDRPLRYRRRSLQGHGRAFAACIDQITRVPCYLVSGAFVHITSLGFRPHRGQGGNLRVPAFAEPAHEVMLTSYRIINGPASKRVGISRRCIAAAVTIARMA